MTTIETASASLVRPVTAHPTHRGIPLSRITTTELRKMFDTRSGFWLMASIGILALLATSAVILFAPNNEMTYTSFATAIGTPMTVILPIIAILSVTGEWSQRSGLTSFTLVPHRGRVFAAKAISCVGVAVVTIPLAFGIGALGNVAGTAIAGVDPVWDLTVTNLLTIVLADVLGLLVGFMLGVVIRSSAGAIGLLRLLVPAARAVSAPRRLAALVPRPGAMGGLPLRAKRPVRRGTDRPAVDPPRGHRSDLAGHPLDCRARIRDESRSQVGDLPDMRTFVDVGFSGE
jgi:ABC-2 type transport system permease protein